MLHIRAFSLFAPLVGTSVMIIAVIVASVLVNNDIRTSRGITASYSRGELAGVTESIKAFIFATTADTVIGAVHDSLAVPPNPALEVICSDSGTCKSGMADAIGTFAPTGIKYALLTAYDAAVDAFVGSVTGASPQNWRGEGKVRDTLGAKMLQKFEAGNLPGEDPKDSYLTIGPGSLKPEDYTLELSKGDIIESVPLLPPQGLRIKLPWGIHALSDTLADASGWAMTGALDSGCSGHSGGCGSESPPHWGKKGYGTADGSSCATSVDAVIKEIKKELVERLSKTDFQIDESSIDVTLKDRTIEYTVTSIECRCGGGSSTSKTTLQGGGGGGGGGGESCTPEYGTDYSGTVNIKKIRIDWKVKSKNAPTLSTELIFGNG